MCVPNCVCLINLLLTKKNCIFCHTTHITWPKTNKTHTHTYTHNMFVYYSCDEIGMNKKTCCIYPSHTHPPPIMSLVIRQTIQLNSRGPPLGWFNSLAGIVKRRFASYVKSHLATTSGDGSKKNRDSSNFGHPMQPTSPYHFEKLCQAPTSSSMPSSPHFGNRAHIDQHYDKERMAAQGPRVFSNIDRRHRSPDPPPR